MLTGRCREKGCWLGSLSYGVNWAILYLLLSLPASNPQIQKHQSPQAGYPPTRYLAASRGAVHQHSIMMSSVVSILPGVDSSRPNVLDSRLGMSNVTANDIRRNLPSC
ncbi:uncharacterized protein BDW47DRAFT_98464 [Aspergillus candidus]|uniref:Uncharacterized protein n=1 Tax=Aspergillus candidus TaxID=41067 RepID=A0A2I2FM87_ASPCN|nr:hypothetical protein BDW47DRAFT_98464 [Aspergillus candidus]PLB41724.1 hypothetical protein BDW47DRAFT_98464 [Aspergillus candidus]